MMTRSGVLIQGMNYAPELTGVGRYTGELARGLAGRGHAVEVVTTPPHYPGWRARPPYGARRYVSEKDGAIRITRCPVVLHESGRGLWRLAAPASFALFSAPVVLWRILRGRPGTVLCVEPTLLAAPVALLGAWLVDARRVLHVQDLEVDAAFAVGHLRGGGRIARLAARFEGAVLSRFDTVVTISTNMAERLVSKGVPRERLRLIRNWVDTARIHPLGRPSVYRRELGVGDEVFVVLYAGQMGPKQSLHLVFEAAERLADRSDIVFVVAGDGPLKDEFRRRFGGLPNVRLLDLQPEERLNELLNLADCHILPQDPAVKDLVLPSKLGGMLASGKEVLVVADDDSELATFVGTSCVRLPTERAHEIGETVVALAEARRRGETGDGAARLALSASLGLSEAVVAFERLLWPLPRMGGR